MTRISTIHGIGQDEFAGRAGMLKPQPFIPYLSMTQGEMSLALLQEEAEIMANFYGSKQYRDAAQMIDNALNAGVHNGIKWIGAVPDYLQNVARTIKRAEQYRQPASNAAFLRKNIGQGVHIGDPIIDYQARRNTCYQWADSADHNYERKRRREECDKIWSIEKILNDGMEKCGTYLAYGYLAGSNALPGLALYKVQDGIKAQQDIGRVGKIGVQFIRQWLNVGMRRINTQTDKVNKPYDFTATNAFLMALPEEGQKEIIALLTSLKDKAAKMGGQIPPTPSQVGVKIAQILRKYKVPKVGEPVTVTLAIVAGVTALISAIAKMAQSLKNEQNDAFSQVNGFGTRAFGPEMGDWDLDGIPNEIDPDPGTPPGSAPGMSTNTMLLLAAGAAALLFLGDDK